MQTYETKEMTNMDMVDFTRWISKHIGVDYELNSTSQTTLYAVILDVTESELFDIQQQEAHYPNI
jgi:hypothetical protein